MKPERNTPWPFSSARICAGPILRLHIYDVAQGSSKGRRMGVRHRRSFGTAPEIPRDHRAGCAWAGGRGTGLLQSELAFCLFSI